MRVSLECKDNPALFCSGSHNYQRLSGLDRKIYFLSSGSWGSKSRCCQCCFLVKHLFLAYRWPLGPPMACVFLFVYLFFFTWRVWVIRERKQEREISGVSSYKNEDTNPIILSSHLYNLFNFYYFLTVTISEYSHIGD